MLHGVDPYTYLVDVLQRIDTHPFAQVEQLTPRLWKHLPGVMAYGETAELALAHVQALALRVLADRLDHDEGTPRPRQRHLRDRFRRRLSRWRAT